MPTVAVTDTAPKRLRRNGLCFASIFVVSWLAGSAAAAELLAHPEHWEKLDIPNRPAAIFTFAGGHNPHGVTVRTDKSVAFLYRMVTDLESRLPTTLTWRWRLERGFAHTDLAAKGKDDRPLAIHLWFSDPARPSVFGALGWLIGYPHITHSLTYVLGGDHPPGSVLTNPYYDSGAIFALRGRTVVTGRWYTETRDIERDIRLSFPSVPMMKTLKYIAISADTDDTGGASLAHMTNLRFAGSSDDKAP